MRKVQCGRRWTTREKQKKRSDNTQNDFCRVINTVFDETRLATNQKSVTKSRNKLYYGFIIIGVFIIYSMLMVVGEFPPGDQ